jgi:hypothetical protein
MALHDFVAYHQKLKSAARDQRKGNMRATYAQRVISPPVIDKHYS